MGDGHSPSARTSDLAAVFRGGPDAPRRRERIGAIIFTGVFGFLAGAVGGLVVVAALPSSSPFAFGSIAAAFHRTLAPRAPFTPPVSRSIAAAVVDVFAVSAAGDLPALLPFEQRMGRGVALTSDGWIVTVRSAVPVAAHGDRRIPVVVGMDRIIRSVDRIAFDPITDLVFLHAAALDAAVLPLHDRRDVDAGIPAYLPTVDGGIAATSIRALFARDTPPSGGRSSDRWATAIALTGDSEAPAGTPIIDADGALMGLTRSDGSAIPVDAMRAALPSLFAHGTVARNALGVTYRDAADFAHRQGEDTDGAVVLAIDRAAAAAAVLHVNDRIVAVGDDVLTARRALADVIQEYPVGARVELHIVHSGKPSTVAVTLATVRGASLLVTVRPPAPASALP